MTNLTSIRIFGKPFEVKFLEDEFESHTLGLCRSIDNSITILADMSPAEELDTVLHELLHKNIEKHLPFLYGIQKTL